MMQEFCQVCFIHQKTALAWWRFSVLRNVCRVLLRVYVEIFVSEERKIVEARGQGNVE